MHALRFVAVFASAAVLAGACPAAVFAQTSPPAAVTPVPNKPSAAPVAPGATTPPMMETTGPMLKATPPARGSMAPAPLALDARALRAVRTATGYTLSGQAQVKDACQASRFDPSTLTIFPPQFNLVQFRRPGTMGMLCIQRLTWVIAAPRAIPSQHPPAYVTVRTAKRTYRVPIK